MKITINRIIFLMAAYLLLILSCTLGGGTTTVACDVADLIAAINSANADAALDILELDSGCVYMLTEVDTTVTSTFDDTIFVYGDVGLPPISTPITINGNNATIRRADDAPDFRIFYITDTGNLILNDLTITNGFADAAVGDGTGSAFPGSGGAIYNARGLLEVNRSTLQENQAGFYGGAIFVFGNTATYVNDSTIGDNSAAHGGGIFVYGEGLLSIEHSTISNNIAATEGGGIGLEYGAELIIKDSVIASNHAGWRGGGIFKDKGPDRLPTTITSTTFQDNTADWSGGGVFIWRTPLTIADSQFLGNQAGEYGGGLGYQNDSTETVQITKNTIFDGNTAGLDGGGIHFSGELMTIVDSTFRNNQAQNGGAIHNAAAELPNYLIRADTTMIIRGSIIQENVASAEGGGIFNGGVLTVEDGAISGNESFTLGGGIHNLGKITVQDSTFKSNTTGLDGGGLNTYSAATVTGSTFLGNSSTRGGGLASVGGDTTLINNTFSDNTAFVTGGGIFNMGPVIGDPSLGGGMAASHITVAYNSAPTGGGIATSGGLMKIKNSIIAHSSSGADCFTAGGDFFGVSENLDSDDSCPGFTLKDDPLLDPLADNGGPTQTHALKVDSPAINAAPDCTTVAGAVVSVDQRSQSRPIGALCDLGSYEYNQAPAPNELQKITPTPEQARVTAIKNANCRYGPSTAYDIRDTLFAGQTARIVGRNEENTWWQIESPTFGSLCWVSYVTVEVNGDVSTVSIGEAPPMPEIQLPEEQPTEAPVVPQGCFVYDQTKTPVCTVPCPANARPGGVCTP